ncbi:mandelate racemase/muconate lactonizing enzyme family protein [Pseudogracilibacillus auburnensis]|uniref:mandelate racemase/muconate lactonizing enzyme family protein n=1 Tax=Pseudogracilibacillus auburnensis TaxID=1494959 RepID=UPI001A957C80|nr:mandelate racemase/muconate lactonizing enzyme family protein [Pseudogracilibacillus auburnensis]MBO1005076.1 mandelate racemase/muconate lactonizing enzyme family protein [Pseudogracilibacillus auburnensis]
MRIQSIETFATKELCIVRIRTNTGEEGFGQTAPYHADITAKVLHQQITPHVLGEDPRDIDYIVDKVITAEHKFPGSYICRAIGGVDTALWDLRGKLEGKSVCEILGGTIQPIMAYGSSMRRDISPVDEANRLKGLMESKGYKAFKIRIANNFGNNIDYYPGRTEEIIPTVRDAIGENTILLVDANSGYTPEKAIEVGKMLEEYNVGHFEEPCPYPEIEWTSLVTSALNIPIAGGEQDTCLSQWKRMIHMRAVDIVQPDVCYLGGISRTLKVAKLSSEAGLICTPHAANLSMVTVFTLHLLGAIDNAGPYIEFSIEDTPWTNDLFYPALEVRDGMVDIPKGPGWGVEINEDWLKKANYQISKLN